MTTTQAQFTELAQQLRGALAVSRELGRVIPPEYPPGSVAVLAVFKRHGDMRMSRLAELLDVDMSVASRHVAHLAERGWIDRLPDPYDKRSRVLRLTPGGAEVLRTCSEALARTLARRLQDWPDEDVTHLTRLLARLREDFNGGDCRLTTRRSAEHPHGPRTYDAADTAE